MMVNNWDAGKARNGKMVNHTYSARSGVASALKVSGGCVGLNVSTFEKWPGRG